MLHTTRDVSEPSRPLVMQMMCLVRQTSNPLLSKTNHTVFAFNSQAGPLDNIALAVNFHICVALLERVFAVQESQQLLAGIDKAHTITLVVERPGKVEGLPAATLALILACWRTMKVFPFVGFSTSALSLLGVYAAQKAIKSVNEKWQTKLRQNSKLCEFPELTGGGAPWAHRLGFFQNYLPIVFMIAWILIFYFSGRLTGCVQAPSGSPVSLQKCKPPSKNWNQRFEPSKHYKRNRVC